MTFPCRNSPCEAVARIIFTAQRASAGPEWPFGDIFAAAGDSAIGEGSHNDQFSHAEPLPSVV